MNPNVHLYRATLRSAFAQLLAVAICTAVTFLFVALTYSQITLPKYTTNYGQKDAQQVVNLLITVVATVIGILLSHCRRLTNEAETRSELRNQELTLPRLHVHSQAAGHSVVTMSSPALYNRDVWRLVAVYLFAITILGFLNSVLSVVFVIESIISDKGEQGPAYIPIGIDIPETYKGSVVDPCAMEIAAPGCSYSLALTALSSQLVTYTPYTVGGVTFEPPNGTLGMPYYAMKHFSDLVESSQFEEERRQYCLPVLDPHLITCKEEPFIQHLGETESRLVRYNPLEVIERVDRGTKTRNVNAQMYEVSVPHPIGEQNMKYRTSDQGQGTMLVRMYPKNPYHNVTVITASDSTGGGGYATLLHQLMYGTDPPDSVISNIPSYSTFYFAAKCEFASIKYRDNYRSSWRKVDFTLSNGVSRANVTEERCPNPRGLWTSGFDDLYFDLEGAGDALSSTDGYSKLFNIYANNSVGTNVFQNMSRLDAIVNQIIHITSTSWTQQTHKYAMKNQTVFDQPVIMTNYPHLYVIRINWTPATYIGLVLSLLITLAVYILAGRWARATYRFGLESESWNLLRPVDLMAYSLAAYQDLIHDINTKEHRRMAMRGKKILHERPVWEGTQSLIGLVSSSTMQSPVSSPTTPGNTPFSTFGGKTGSPAGGGGGGYGVTINEKASAPEDRV